MKQLFHRLIRQTWLWPIGIFILKRHGFQPFTLRAKRHWWYAGYYEKENSITLYPYQDAIDEILKK